MIFGFILGLLWRRPRHGRFRFDGKAILFGVWMTPWLLIGGQYHNGLIFWLGLLLWIAGAVTLRCWNNYHETKEKTR